MIIVKSTIKLSLDPNDVSVYYYKGSETGEWSNDEHDAALYKTKVEATVDIKLGLPVYVNIVGKAVFVEKIT